MPSALRFIPGSRALRVLCAVGCLALLPCAVLAQDNFRFVVIGDSRAHTCDYNSATPANCINVAVLKQINTQIQALDPKPAFVIANGDLARYGATRFYDAWARIMKSVTDIGIPVYVTFGNHELHTANGGLTLQGQIDFQKFFSGMPQNGPPGYEGLAYSFTYGNSFFLILDTFHATPTVISEEPYIAPDQFAWADAQTAAANANPAIVHKFAVSHAPAFSAASANYAAYTRELWSIVDNNAYDVLFGAHEHVYARVLVNELFERPDPASPWLGNAYQVIAGNAGGPLDETPNGNADVSRIQFGYTVVDVRGRDVSVKSYSYEDGMPLLDAIAMRKETLAVGRTGSGRGTVQSAPPMYYVNCGAACTANFNQGATVTLTATADADSVFTGWKGDCWGMDPCTVRMSVARSVEAGFAAMPTLIVRKIGFGDEWGSVVSSPAGIDCGPTCTAPTAPGTHVVLRATALAGGTFSKWAGACTGTQEICTVVMTGNQTVVATFGTAP